MGDRIIDARELRAVLGDDAPAAACLAAALRAWYDRVHGDGRSRRVRRQGRLVVDGAQDCWPQLYVVVRGLAPACVPADWIAPDAPWVDVPPGVARSVLVTPMGLGLLWAHGLGGVELQKAVVRRKKAPTARKRLDDRTVWR